MKNDTPAFPQGKSFDSISLLEGGMTLRDYFAAKAMAAMLANPHLTERYGTSFDHIASEAFGYADAMIAFKATTVAVPREESV